MKPLVPSRLGSCPSWVSCTVRFLPSVQFTNMIRSQGPYESNKAWATLLVVARWMGSPIISLSYILWNIRVLGNIAMMGGLISACVFSRSTSSLLSVDMSVGIDEPSKNLKSRFQRPEEDIQWDTPAIIEKKVRAFYDMRDSLYILGVMNQYNITRVKRKDQDIKDYTAKRAEGLLRIVLFSHRLLLPRQVNCPEHPETIQRARRLLASNLRRTRKRGIVPVFVSTLWFIFALSLSIYTAFSEIGTNSVAHDLALGLLLGWLPILILCSIVDRNPTDPDGNLKDLNALVLSVCRSLVDKDNFKKYYKAVIDLQKDELHQVEPRAILTELLEIRKLCQYLVQEQERTEPKASAGNAPRGTPRDLFDLRLWFCHTFGPQGEPAKVTLFGSFAGQARERWHYGAAHPILSEIEHAFIGGESDPLTGKREPGKRNWLGKRKAARLHLVLGRITSRKGLIWWDNRELWQIFAAAIIVYVTCFAAFVLSYNTPTVGLGCRSGGYLIYVVLSTLLLLLELLAWRVDWRNLPVKPRDQTAGRSEDEEARVPNRTRPAESRLDTRDHSSPFGPASTPPLSTHRYHRSSQSSLGSDTPLLPTRGEASGSPYQAALLSPPRNDSYAGSSRHRASTPTSRTVSPYALGFSHKHSTLTGQTAGLLSSRSPFSASTPDDLTSRLEQSDRDQRENPNAAYEWFEPIQLRSYFKNLVLIPLEILNASWLIYIVFAQTSGGYRSCECVTSSWELGERGYLDFTQNNIANTPSLPYY